MDQALLLEEVLPLHIEQEKLKFEDDQNERSYFNIPATFYEYLAILHCLDKNCDLRSTEITFVEDCLRINCGGENINKFKEMIVSLLHEIQASNWEEILLKPEEEIMFDLPKDDMVTVFHVEEERKIILFSKSKTRLNLITHKVMVLLGRTIVAGRGKRYQASINTDMLNGLPLALSKDSRSSEDSSTPMDSSTSNQNKSTQPSEGTFHTENGIMIKVYSMKITETDVECIVNATDLYLRNSQGVSKAIANAAGMGFKQACQNHIQLNGPLKKNQPLILSSGSLNYRSIINIAGPVKRKNDEIQLALSQLECIIVESLKAVDGSGLKSVAFPSVSAGYGGLQTELCAQKYCSAVDKFSKSSGGQLNLKEIHFVDINEDTTQVIKDKFAMYFSSQRTKFPSISINVSQSLTSDVSPMEGKEMIHTECSSLRTDRASYSDETNSYSMSPAKGSKDATLILYYLNKTAIKVIIGDICDITADALVSIEDEYGSGNGNVARAILKAAGRRYREFEHSKVKMARRSITEIVVTGSGELKSKFVLHAIAPEWNLEAKGDKLTFRKTVTRTVMNVMDAACKQKLKSLAVPLIGTSTDDKYEEPLATCCESMIDGLHQWIKSHSYLYWFDTVIIICSNEAASQWFTNLLPAKLEKEFREKGRFTSETPSKPSNVESKSRANTPRSSDMQRKDRCDICMESITNPKVLPKCSHTFCKECIDKKFRCNPVCPCCGLVYGKITGIQPEGTMNISYEMYSLPGFEMCGTIVILYEFKCSTQKEEHPNPGRLYYGTKRTAYLPNNDRGKLVLRLLQEAFKRRLVFTFGTSRTTGKQNTIIWNDILHKTSRDGGPQKYGYPDEAYLSRVMEDLAAKGVTEESLEEM